MTEPVAPSGSRQILAAAFSTPEGASRAVAAVAGAFPDKIGNAAVLYVSPSGTPRFVELRDWGAGRGALLGGLVGLIGGPLGVLAGSGIGALAARLRDAGFKDHQLRRLGTTLAPNSSAVVLEIAEDALPGVRRLVTSLEAHQIVVEPLHSSVADLFSGVQAPATDPEPAAASR
jgi:uncharacterized membrane protein